MSKEFFQLPESVKRRIWAELLAEEKPGRAAQAVHSGFFVSAADRGGAGPSRC